MTQNAKDATFFILMLAVAAAGFFGLLYFLGSSK